MMLGAGTETPPNGPSPGPLSTWGGHRLCHKSLEGARAPYAVGIFRDLQSGEVGGPPGGRGPEPETCFARQVSGGLEA